MIQSHSFEVEPHFAEKLAVWASQADFGFCFRGSGWGAHIDFSFETFAGSGIEKCYSGSLDKAFDFVANSKRFIVAHLSYELKDELENLSSKHADYVGFSPLQLTIPEWIIFLNDSKAKVIWNSDVHDLHEASQLISTIERLDFECRNRKSNPVKKNQNDKSDYLKNLEKVKGHIQKGDIYQANLCQQFYWTDVDIDGAKLFNKGFQQNPNPFSVYYKSEGKEALCFSPERFLTINDRKVVSQPMKGTSARSNDPDLDLMNLTALKNSEKDRRENVMIVDMVRNDLSHLSVPGSVHVPELYKIESYKKVHQMYSTVSAMLLPDVNPFAALVKAFPMGSMTGAPKVRAMQIIEEVEWSKRGLFSGSIGFITPDLSMDFNVVIRSLLYNAETRFLSCHAGGGITDLSDPEAEFEETLVKAGPMFQLVEEFV